MHTDTKRAQEKEPGYYALKNSYFTTWPRKKKICCTSTDIEMDEWDCRSNEDGDDDG